MPYATILFLIAHGAALLWLMVHPERVPFPRPLRFAWICYVAALIPGALSANLFWLVVAWGLLVASGALVFLAIEPVEEKPPKRKKERVYEPIMPHRDENPPTAPAPPEPPMI